MEKLIHIKLGTEKNADACASDGDSGKNFLTSRTFNVWFNIQLGLVINADSDDWKLEA